MSGETPAPPPPPAVRAFAALLRAHAATTRSLNVELQAAHGLTVNDYEALFALSRADGQQLRRVDLSRLLALTASGVTRLLEGLERAGLVERAHCASDQRVTYARLTPAGAERLLAASCAHVGSIRTLFGERYSPEEIERLAELLAKLPSVAEEPLACAAEELSLPSGAFSPEA